MFGSEWKGEDIRARPVAFSKVQPTFLLLHLHPEQTSRYAGLGAFVLFVSTDRISADADAVEWTA